MYYSAICFEEYADISLFPTNYPNSRLLDLSNINVEELNKRPYVIILSIHELTLRTAIYPFNLLIQPNLKHLTFI